VPIETPEAPRPSIEALQAMLPALAGSAGIRQSAPNFAASLLASPRSLSSPGLSYPVYGLGLADVASGAGVGKAKLSVLLCPYRTHFPTLNQYFAAKAPISVKKR